MTPDDIISLTIASSGHATPLSLSSSTTLDDLAQLVSLSTLIAPEHQKLIHRGRRLDRATLGQRTLVELGLTEGSTVGVIGPQSEVMRAVREADDLRRKKREGYAYHAGRHATVRTTTVRTVGDGDEERYAFARLVPFPPEVPCLEQRQRMLDRLAADPAVKDLMLRHKYHVGILWVPPLSRASTLGLILPDRTWKTFLT